MGKIFLIRHGESGPSSTWGGDFQRSLTDRGKTTLLQLADALKNEVKAPVKIHCSSAKRTVETATILAKHLNGSIHKVADLYNGEVVAYLDLLRTLEINSQILVVGHNPTITEVHERLTGTLCLFEPGTCAILEKQADGGYQQVALLHAR